MAGNARRCILFNGILTASLIVSISSSVISSTRYSVPGPGLTSIGSALSQATEGDTVSVKAGIYRELVMPGTGVYLEADPPRGAVIDGGGKGVCVTLASNSTVSGFEIRNGTIGIFSSGVSNTIRQCRIVNNAQSGIMCVGDLPAMQDNVIAYN
jgi:nitrous oxidase accessory protein NosD